VVQANISVLRIAPLQLYSSALLFTPKNSVIRSRFGSQIPPCISVHPRTEQDWGQHILTLEDHSQEVTHVSFSSDSSILATGSKDDTIRLCDTNTGKRIRSLRSYGRVSATAFSHDMALLAVASCMSDISQWMSSKTNKITVRLWRVDTGEFIWSSRCYEDGKFYLGFGPENVLLICSTSKDKTVWLRCANNGHCIQEVVESDSCVTSVAFSQNSELTASANTNRIIRLQNFIDHDDHVKLKSHSNYVTAMSFSNDSKILASGCSKTICLWHVDTGECIRKLDHTTHGDTLLFSHDLTLAVSVLVDGSIHRWRVDTGEALQTLDPPEGSSIALSHDLGLIATGSRIGTVRLWHATSTIGVRSHINHKKQVSRIVFSPDSAYLASLASNNDIRIWRVDTGEQLRQFRSGTGSVSSLIFSNDSRLIASVAADRRVRVWEVHTGMRIQVFDLEFIAGDEALSFSHDSKTIFLTWLGGWHTWCVETRKHQVRYLALKSKWNRSALSPDSKLLAFSTPYQTAYGARGASPADNFSSIYGAVSLYSVKTGESISTIRQFIIPLNFSDDSKILVTFNQDTIQLWSTETWRFIRSVNIRGITSFLNFQPSTNTLTTQFGAFVQGSLRSSFRGSGYGFSRDYQWVIKDGTGVLWLPPEYRPCNSAVQGHVIAYGCTSGSVYVLAFSD
jgi:WD40 repeat protein